jgi:hypothetical protein
LSNLSVGDEHKIPRGGDCNLVFGQLKSGRLFSLPLIGVGVQIDLRLAGFAAALALGPISL